MSQLLVSFRCCLTPVLQRKKLSAKEISSFANVWKPSDHRACIPQHVHEKESTQGKKCVVTLHFAKVGEPCLHLSVGNTVWLIEGRLERNISSSEADISLWLCHHVDNSFWGGWREGWWDGKKLTWEQRWVGLVSCGQLATSSRITVV